jgi:hypothetical protein
MAEKNILVVPQGYQGPIDPVVDEVRTDPEAEYPHTIQEYVSDAGEGVLDRNLVTESKVSEINSAIFDYEEAKSNSDTQGQLDALEIAVSHMWDVISGQDIGSASETQ